MRAIHLVLFIFTLSTTVILSCSSNPPRKPASAAATGAAHRHPMHKQVHFITRDVAEINASCDTIGWSDRVETKGQQDVINSIFANRAHRTQHALWHSIRGDKDGMSADQTNAIVSAFGQPWAHSHPLCPAPLNNPADSSYNPVGEDFLYMHHQMVLLLRQELVAAKQKCILGWDHMPDPHVWKIPDAQEKGAKSTAAYNRMLGWDGYFTDANWLKTVSLSQLGWALEFTIHNNLHMRYATLRPAKPFQGVQFDGADLPMNNVFPANWKFDDPKYNWLADPYGAAVNPLFWKIHGYVDHILDLWLAANSKDPSHPLHIREQCGTDANCYEWKGTWVGEVPPVLEGKPGNLSMTAADVRAAGHSLEDDVDRVKFNQDRLRFQRIGVIEDTREGGDEKGGMLGAAAPTTPVDDAMSSIGCKE